MNRMYLCILAAVLLSACSTTNAPAPLEITDEKGVTMLLIPAGEFTMGADFGDNDMEPVQQVYLDAYYIDKYEVTNALYRACVSVGACRPPHDINSHTHFDYYGNPEFDNYPVINVDWDQALTYCRWRGAGLPTETEWEKAANWDDDKQEKRLFPWGDTLDCSFANYVGPEWDGCVGDTTRVGSYPSGASFYGLLDMAGNVAEWVADWYDAYPGNTMINVYYGKFGRVLRGGSSLSYSYFVTSSSRAHGDPVGWSKGVGFRCAR